MANYDMMGNICLVKFNREEKIKDKKKWGEKFLSEHKQVGTVLEKSGKFSGRLRTQTSKFIAGEKTKEVLYKENSCLFRFNIDSCYFSPRLSADRKEIALKVKKGESVLVMFGGVAPYAIVIGKLSGAKEVISIELGRECTKYAKINVLRNKLENVEIVGGDVRRKVPELERKFDRIVMSRPNLKDSFLNVAFKAIKKGGVIYYHGFYYEFERKKLKEMVLSEARRARKKVRILGVKKVAGGIGVRKFRYRIDFKVN